ncbi:MAG TPA: hypothetical protein VL866_24195 [Pyrinomonadaceae bacterium]|nr:hypothetical protein [Pyrinomonadaceae bacterium]
MDEREEAAYALGQKSIYREMLGTALRHLDSDEYSREELIKERVDTIAVLRGLCEEHGDNDWDDDLYLADVVSKHLGDHLDS